MSRSRLRVATRASNLALWQANFVADSLRALDAEFDVELVHITTTGDRSDQATLRQLGGVGVFTREIQQAVLDNRADVAVHSLKDLPTEPVEGITLGAVPERASPFDALVFSTGKQVANTLEDLPPGARVGTGSLRRRSQISHWRPDVQFLEIRGNVDTRLRKLDEGACDALILAEAGLNRLGLSNRISARLAPPVLFPAVGQGALGLECRVEDRFVQTVLQRLSHPPTMAAVTAERQVLARLQAGCHAPVGVTTAVGAGQITLEAVVLSPDGKERLFAKGIAPIGDPVSLGTQVADELLRLGAGPMIEAAEA